MPHRLAAEDGSDLTILGNRAFHWPMFYRDHLHWTFASTRPIDDAASYAHHLWESIAWDYLDGLTVRKVREHDTNFHRWLRPLLRDLPEDFAPETIWNAGHRAARRAGALVDDIVHPWRRAARRAAGQTLQIVRAFHG